ncbi:hypothetical protein [Flavobacterium sp.]|uniref:hypothetical protein n=1 Tax=Flavobacterium sp. TaxID=239 RepID=UPI0039E4BC54
MKILTTIIISLFFLSALAKNKVEFCPHNLNDTVKVDYVTRLQKTVDLFIKGKKLFLKKEYLHAVDLFAKTSDAETYAKFLIYNKYPEIKNSPYEFEMSEDKTKKLWFIYMSIPHTLDGDIYMIMIKNNGEILFLNNFCCPE